jgi:hypothetical protein
LVVLKKRLWGMAGSATFIAANQAAQFEIQVSTTGLLIRKVE